MCFLGLQNFVEQRYFIVTFSLAVLQTSLQKHIKVITRPKQKLAPTAKIESINSCQKYLSASV